MQKVVIFAQIISAVTAGSKPSDFCGVTACRKCEDYIHKYTTKKNSPKKFGK